jgi:hypothetical protein
MNLHAIYSPFVDLLERCFGYWAVALHSIVLGAFWTLVVYAVYRLVRRYTKHAQATEWQAARFAS